MIKEPGMTRIQSVFVQVSIMAFASLVFCVASEAVAETSPGEEAFVKHCSVCHAKGGNIINPAKPLSKKDLGKNGVRKAADIVAKMRNPGPGMTTFDKSTVPDKTAQEIAEYILKTFK
jgi:cytochrome c6